MAITLISTQTVSSAVAGLTFSSIPATYTDIFATISARSDGSSVDIRVRFNGDTGSNYTYRRLYGTGVSTGSDSATQTSIYIGSIMDGTSQTSNTFGNAQIYIPNYAGSTAKSLSVDGVIENNATNPSYQHLVAGLWSGTAAISTLYIYADANNFNTGTTISLYGVLKGSSGGVTVS